MEGFNHPCMCWKGNTAGHKESRKFLECIDNNFLTQVIEELMRGEVFKTQLDVALHKLICLELD